MSGGRFDYKQSLLTDLADDVEETLNNNHIRDEFGYSDDLPKEAVEAGRKAVEMMREAYVLVQRLDWLVSGDDGLECFQRRLSEDLAGLGHAPYSLIENKEA